jgi:hypothetical protein
VNTALDVSMPMRLISDMDGSCLGYMTAQVWHPMPWGRPPQQAYVHLKLGILGVMAGEGPPSTSLLMLWRKVVDADLRRHDGTRRAFNCTSAGSITPKGQPVPRHARPRPGGGCHHSAALAHIACSAPWRMPPALPNARPERGCPGPPEALLRYGREHSAQHAAPSQDADTTGRPGAVQSVSPASRRFLWRMPMRVEDADAACRNLRSAIRRSTGA